MWAFNLVPLVFFLFNWLFFDVFFFRLRLSLVFSFFLFDTVFFRFFRFFTGVVFTESVSVSVPISIPVSAIFIIFVGVFFVIFVIPSVSVHTSFFFFFFFVITFFFRLAVIRFFVGVLRGGGPPVVRHSSVGSLGSTGADMMKEWRGAGSRIRGSRQKYDT